MRCGSPRTGREHHVERRRAGSRRRAFSTQAPPHVLDVDDRVVHELADGDRQAAEGHRVEPMPEAPTTRARLVTNDSGIATSVTPRSATTQEHHQHERHQDRAVAQRLLHVATAASMNVGLPEQHHLDVARGSVRSARGRPRPRSVSATVEVPGCFWTDRTTPAARSRRRRPRIGRRRRGARWRRRPAPPPARARRHGVAAMLVGVGRSREVRTRYSWLLRSRNPPVVARRDGRGVRHHPRAVTPRAARASGRTSTSSVSTPPPIATSLLTPGSERSPAAA
jgi:hypothetical protein